MTNPFEFLLERAFAEFELGGCSIALDWRPPLPNVKGLGSSHRRQTPTVSRGRGLRYLRCFKLRTLHDSGQTNLGRFLTRNLMKPGSFTATKAKISQLNGASQTPKPKTQNPSPKTPNPKPKTHDLQPTTRIQKPQTQKTKTQNPKPKTQNPKPNTPNTKPSHPTLPTKRGWLDRLETSCPPRF
jgi:hypothetical protein